MNNKTKKMVYASLLTAMAIIIPVQFSFLRVYIPPFSATLAAHVPMFVAMLISPGVAVTVGLGSTLGFLFTGLDIVVVLRAATHILVGYVGAKIIAKRKNYLMAAIITAPIHGGLEMLVSIPFVGLDLYKLLIVTCVGAMLHHSVDAFLSLIIVKASAKAGRKDFYIFS
ncbi:MAG: ECF transporter S component [Clostridium sp.]|uniref:ECF transporter S component n=1 Tax=Clostridium sp. DSM 8431 TaxID=1761781 RepID=UPI0008E1B5A2|nr:ECF transporter S component [Clostridium sp. DSM 8431]MCR4943010.1 ECF transporter S component [Clostridium sp.]SFU67935.1 niacin transporter [Clostridium sp. DSM 8431]